MARKWHVNGTICYNARKMAEEHLKILDLLGKYPSGTSMHELLKHISTPKRTLVRHLNELIQKGEILKDGRGRGTRYFAKKGLAPKVHPAIKISLSTEGETIQRYIQSPLTERTPVGYHREFLENYQPNNTFFLPEPLRLELQKIGKQPDGEQPAGSFARKILDRLLIDLSWNSSRLEGNT